MRHPDGGARPARGGRDRAAAGPGAAATGPGHRARPGRSLRDPHRRPYRRPRPLPRGAAVARAPFPPLPAHRPRLPAGGRGRRAGAGRGRRAGRFYACRGAGGHRLAGADRDRCADRARGGLWAALPRGRLFRPARRFRGRAWAGGGCGAPEGPGERGAGDPPRQPDHRARGGNARQRHSCRAVRGPLARALPLRRCAARGRQPCREAGARDHLAHKDHGQAGHRRAPPAAGWAHQDGGARHGDRFPRLHHSVALRRKGRVARARPQQRVVRLRQARAALERGGGVVENAGAAERHFARHWSDRVGKDHDAVHGIDGDQRRSAAT